MNYYLFRTLPEQRERELKQFFMRGLGGVENSSTVALDLHCKLVFVTHEGGSTFAQR